MKKTLIVFSAAGTIAGLFGSNALLAQNSSPYWSLAGNSNATSSSKLGTTNSNVLRFFTNNAERARIATNGRIGIGTTAAPTARLQVVSATGEAGLAVTINTSTKFQVHSNGGVSVGGSNVPQANGLYVGGLAGVGTSNPGARLDVRGDGTTKPVISAQVSYTGEFDIPGVISTSNPQAGWGIGVEGHGGYKGGAFYGDNYGVYGLSDASVGDSYGVYGEAYGDDFSAAGYFLGDVYAFDYFTLSDRKFKKDITPVTNVLQDVMKLKPSTYTFNEEGITSMNLPKGNKLGLIADEVKQVLPQLVKRAVRPAKYNADRSVVLRPEIKYESVNYLGLVPVLIAATQEQQKQIESQQNQIDELKELVKQLTNARDIKTSLNNIYLEQNNPNPLSNITTISYSIPPNSKNAQLIVNDLAGKTIKVVQLGSSARGKVSFDATGLASGTYSYSIIVDGQLSQSKKMIVSRK